MKYPQSAGTTTEDCVLHVSPLGHVNLDNIQEGQSI